MAESIRFYVDGLGFAMTKQWTPKGNLEWCWLEREGAALMLQQYRQIPEDKLGVGVDLCFNCDDAIAFYHEVKARGVQAKQPFVGNGLWVVGLCDPDGYSLAFNSPTNVPEETVYSE